MISVELKPLLAHLSPTCLRAVEAGAGACIARGHYETTVEHVLLQLVDGRESDFTQILDRFEVDRARLARSLTSTLESFRSGNSGKPVLSPLLVEWIESAWMTASIDHASPVIRSSDLAIALASRPRRLLATDQPELEKIGLDTLKRELADLTRGSPEEGHAPPRGSAARGPVDPNSALGKFASNLTAAAREGKIDPVFGRDREIRQLVDILSRRRKNNPIVVGEAGVGKTAIVEGLALRIAQRDVPDFLQDVDIYALDLGLLQAGAGVKGEFESRLKSVIDEVRAATRSTILFIDEAHTLVGAGGSSGGSDAANLLKPALARGELRTIAATTWAEYKKYFEEDAALARRFQPVKVDEPSVEVAASMLRGIKDRYEKSHGVLVRDDAIDAAASLSARYISGRQLPDKGVDLLDTAAARVRIQQTSRTGALEDLEREVAALDRQLARARARPSGGGAASRCRQTGQPSVSARRGARQSERDEVAAQ